MPRYKLTIEYDGSDFAGWQRQANDVSVQEAIETAVAGMSGEAVTLFGAGRTDAGVHATGQVAHLDLTREWSTDTVRDALNAHLRPHPVSILAAERVPGGFDARFSGIRRRYLYRIINRRPPAAIERGHAWHVVNGLDVAAMAAGGERLLGHHDFTTFRASHCQAKSPMKTLEELTVERDGELVLVRAAARSFLHNQVRSMVGSLVLVGQGRWAPDDVAAALAARDRKRCGPVAPPDGLYLTAVEYKPLSEIPDAPPPNTRAAARDAARLAATAEASVAGDSAGAASEEEAAEDLDIGG